MQNARLTKLQQEIMTSNQSTQGGRVRPHKQALLLAVLDLFDSDLLTENQIHINEELNNRFEKYFNLLAIEKEVCRLERPFFHLRSSGFWNHKVRDGQTEAYKAIKVADAKPVKDTIEYAFLREDVFELLQSVRNRDELRGFIFRITMISQVKQNSGFTFHRSFTLMRPGIAQFLHECSTSERSLTTKEIHGKTTLGSSQAQAMPAYAKRAGLLDSNNQLTPFGRVALQHDPQLSQNATLWMMHYFLAASHYNAPSYWSFLSELFLDGDNQISNDSTQDKLAQFAVENSPRAMKPRTLSDSVTAFLGTYTKPDALGALNILRSLGEGRYEVTDEFAPRPLGVVACALGDFWTARFGGAAKVNLEDVTGPQGLGRVLLLSMGELSRHLGALQREGVVRLERATPPHQIARGWDEADSLWERLYAL